MRMGKTHEMRNFLLSVSALVIALIVLLVLVNTLFAIHRINQDQEREKQNVKDSLLRFFEDSLKGVPKLQSDPELQKSLDPGMITSYYQGDMTPIAKFLTAILQPLYATEYVVLVNDGQVLSASLADNLKDFQDFPLVLPNPALKELQSEILTNFNGKQGYFIQVFEPLNIPGTKGAFFAFLVDRSLQVEQLNQSYADEKSSLILQQVILGLVAVAIALAIGFVGIRLLTRYFITGPVENLAETSRLIMEGAFEGEVKVDERSDFADLQRLLQSGKTLVDRMFKET